MWPTITKYYSVIVLEKKGKCMLYSRNDLFTIL